MLKSARFPMISCLPGRVGRLSFRIRPASQVKQGEHAFALFLSALERPLMLDYIRNHRRLMQFVLLLFIVPSFAFFGLEGYNRMSNEGDEVASVDGEPITRQELDQAMHEQLQRMRQMLGSRFDPAQFDNDEARADVLDSIITQRVLVRETVRNNLSVSDRKLQETIMAMPAVQENGAFSLERYKTLLAAQGYTETRFESGLRGELAMQQIAQSFEKSVIVPDAAVEQLAAIVSQIREVGELRIRAADYSARTSIGDAEIRKYYESNPGEFEIPDKIKAEYVVLNADALAGRVNVSEAALRGYYEQNKSRYGTDEERRASHILIRVPEGADQATQDKAKEKAEKLLAQVKANPVEFARLAKENSEDPGSAGEGGDLGFFGRGAMVPAFEAAVFALQENGISSVVRSDFGYHIIMLTGIKPADVKPFESVRAEIEAEVRHQEASRLYAEAADQFADLVYVQFDSLKPTAEKLGLTIEIADGLTRNPDPAADGKAPLDNTKLRTALFSDEVLKDKRNTEAIEVSPSVMVAARVAAYTPASRIPLEQAAAGIRERLVAGEAARLAAQAGEKILADLRTGKADATGFSAPRPLNRAMQSELSDEAMASIFRVDVSALPAYAGAAMPDGDYAVYRIESVTTPPLDEANRALLKQNMATQLGQIEFEAWLEAARKRAKVKIAEPFKSILEKKKHPV